MRVYDTLSQELKEFSPLEDNKVKMYVCGPTVYDYPHLGHARCYITWDMVSKYLRFKGYDVTYVRNITDVDDKIIAKARETNSSPREIAEKYYKEFENNMTQLNIAKPDIEPRATDNIQEMIDIIKTLIEKGFAYPSDGDVYFRVNKCRKYGMLSKQNIIDLEAGARINVSEKKENPLDFTLWKATKSEDEIGWDSPWGKGRPGWHIECSAMIRKYLGESIDIHAGGQDLIFPHHENEKAQSEAAFDIPFVKYWIHNGFVIINQEKMSKSLGNFITINDVLKQYDANTIRFFILTNHYRTPVEFTDEGLKSAKSGIKRLNNAIEDVKSVISKSDIQEAEEILDLVLNETVKAGHLPFHNIDVMQHLEDKIPAEIMATLIKGLKSFLGAMDDDFNTSKALAVLFDIANHSQKVKDSDKPKQSAFCIALLLKFSDILGFNFKQVQQFSNDTISQLMEVILSTRNLARIQKNWEMSDKIRDDLAKTGIVLKDRKDGATTWSFSNE